MSGRVSGRGTAAAVLFLAAAAAVTLRVDGQTPEPVRVQVQGIELHYVERGQGEPVILLHGGTGDYRSWGPQLDALSARYRVISYSRRYHHPNRNTPVPDHSAHVEARDLAAFMRQLGIPRAHLVGTSYGAFTALALALEEPQTVRSLVLAEPPVHRWALELPGGRARYDAFLAQVWRPAGEAFAEGDDRRAMRLLADGIWGQQIFETLPPEAVAAAMQNARAMHALTASSDAFPPLSREAVRALRIPALVIRGERTIELHKLVNAELARLTAGGKEIVIPQAGHGSPRENPQAFNEAVVAFLAALP